MKWIGQHIVDLIARFRSDVYMEDVSTGTIASGGNLGLDSNNKIVKANEATGDITGVTLAGDSGSASDTSGNVDLTIKGGNAITTSGSSTTITINHDDTSTQASVDNSGRTFIQDIELDDYGHVRGITSATDSDTYTGDITGIVIATDSGEESGAAVDAGVAAFSILGTSGVGVTNSGTTITATSVPGEINHNGLLNFEAAQHFEQGDITTVGTIGTGVWEGTKVSSVFANTGGRRYGNILKILPQDFMVNHDVLTEPLTFKDGGNSGVAVSNTASEMIAFVAIPEGMKATALDIYSTNNKAVKIFEIEIDDSFDFDSATANESGNANTQITIDPAINATALNYLAIIYVATATSNRIWGGALTIAPQ